MPAPAVEPQPHVRILDLGSSALHEVGGRTAAPRDWLVVDGAGARAGETPSRGEAVRLMSRLALRSRSVLPLTVVDPDGHPTGDRLA
jgi:hypothetical protein